MSTERAEGASGEKVIMPHEEYKADIAAAEARGEGRGFRRAELALEDLIVVAEPLRTKAIQEYKEINPNREHDWDNVFHRRVADALMQASVDVLGEDAPAKMARVDASNKTGEMVVESLAEVKGEIEVDALLKVLTRRGGQLLKPQEGESARLLHGTKYSNIYVIHSVFDGGTHRSAQIVAANGAIERQVLRSE